MDIERLQQAEGPWPSGEIWIADMARVVASLGVDLADHVTLTKIAELLGMQMPAPVRRASQTGAPHSGSVPPLCVLRLLPGLRHLLRRVPRLPSRSRMNRRLC